jgi:phage terminase small subunit
MKNRSIRTEISADRVLKELARIAFHDPANAFRPDGSMKPIHEMDDVSRAALVIEVTEGTDGEGNPTFSRKMKFADKQVALEKLAKNLGLLTDKLKVSGDEQNPLVLFLKSIQGTSIKPVHEGVNENAPVGNRTKRRDQIS